MTHITPHHMPPRPVLNIAVFGATGDVGREVVAEALARGHRVTAIARTVSRLADLSPLVTRQSLDVLENPDLVAAAMAEHDLAISALRPTPGQEGLLAGMTKVLLDSARTSGTPLYVTGGAAMLKLADGSGHTVLSAPDFLPDPVRPIAEACAMQDALFDLYDDVAWTCLRPPAMLFDGEKTRHYMRGTDTLVTDHDGVARISYADFAVAMIDLAEAGDTARQRLTVGYRGKADSAPDEIGPIPA